MWTGVILGTVGAVSSENWPSIWIILEVNLICFIPLITKKIEAKKTRLLYFVVQRVGSLIILRGGVLRDWNTTLRKWVTFGVLLKRRLAPFHFWGAALVSKLSEITSFIFLTWQKIAPLLIMLLSTGKNLLLIFVLTNVFISAMCGVGSKKLNILLFFSGLMHVGWIITAPLLVSTYYYLMYTLSILPLFIPNIKFDHPILIMNLAGLPPLTGFIMKLIVLQRIRYGLGCLILLISSPLIYAYMRSFLSGGLKHLNIAYPTMLVCTIGWVLV